MKRILLVAAIIVPHVCGQGYDKTSWGMTEPQVRALYPDREFSPTDTRGNPVLSGELYSYTTILGARVTCVFHFGGVGLDSVSLALSEKFGEGNKLSEVSEALSAKFGAPSEVRHREKIWVTRDSIITANNDRFGATYTLLIEYKPRGTVGL